MDLFIVFLKCLIFSFNWVATDISDIPLISLNENFIL